MRLPCSTCITPTTSGMRSAGQHHQQACLPRTSSLSTTLRDELLLPALCCRRASSCGPRHSSRGSQRCCSGASPECSGGSAVLPAWVRTDLPCRLQPPALHADMQTCTAPPAQAYRCNPALAQAAVPHPVVGELEARLELVFGQHLAITTPVLESHSIDQGHLKQCINCWFGFMSHRDARMLVTLSILIMMQAWVGGDGLWTSIN